jgi:DNA repair exonuclease SbcCD nuclease subunit
VVRFLHTADWQLGMTRHFLSAEAQARFTAARLDALRAIGALAAETGSAFVVVAGDVFESNHIDRQVLVRALEAMATIPVPVLLLPGNHDPLDAASIYRSPTFVRHRPDHVQVLDGLAVPVPGVEVIGAPWSSKRPLEDLVGAACSGLVAAPGTLRVLVGHGAVDHLAPDADDPALIRVAAVDDALARGCVHYVALGDRHSTTSVGRSGRIWYAGAPEPTDFDEVEPGQVLLVDLAEDAVTVERRQVATWRFVRAQFDLTAEEDLDTVERWLTDLPDKDRTMVRLGFVGTITLRQRSRLDGLLAHFGEVLAALDEWRPRTDLAVVPDDGDFADLDLSGFAAAATNELRAGAAAGDDVARDALALLHRLGSRAS